MLRYKLARFICGQKKAVLTMQIALPCNAYSREGAG
jgi:hypothetical protein